MDLGTIVNGLKRKSSVVAVPEKPKSETLVAGVVPKKIFQDTAYKDELGIVKDDYGKYFDSCAFDLCRVFMDVYAPTFGFERKVKQEQLQYSVTHDDVTVRYIIRGADRYMSLDRPEGWSNDISGILTIQQPTLNLEQTSTFVQAALEYNLLDYRERKPEKFGVFYHGMDGKVKMEGLPLLQVLGIKLSEAVEYISIMIYGKYNHKQFSADEIGRLFPESVKQ